MKTSESGRSYPAALVVGALGVVYGDIGTSPLYALRECFNGRHGVQPTPENVLGVVSLIFWALTLMVTVKYLGLVLRADHKGEGGILALLSLAVPERDSDPRRATGFLLLLGLFGAALLYGDGMITPAVTVLGAVEGIAVATPVFQPYVVPVAIGVLVVLFSVQRFGTGRVGTVFGPVMVVWFLVLALLGLRGIWMAPRILQALSPQHAGLFLWHNGPMAFVVLGAVFLAVTGAEALYADMGHFGAQPIRKAWFAVVFPGLLLNYLGEGGLLLVNPEAARNPFVDESERVRVERVRPDIHRVIGCYGFMEQPNIPELLESCAAHGLPLAPAQITFFLSRETIIPKSGPGLARWRRQLFAAISRNAQSATAFFQLPPNRVVELGMQVEV